MSQTTDGLLKLELRNLLESKGPLSPEAVARLKRLLPNDLQTPLAQLQFIEMTLPLRQRRLFTGLQGDYQIIDENGRTVWASEWCNKAYHQTCPRNLTRRSRD